MVLCVHLTEMEDMCVCVWEYGSKNSYSASCSLTNEISLSCVDIMADS